jgi:hypothetical protein
MTSASGKLNGLKVVRENSSQDEEHIEKVLTTKCKEIEPCFCGWLVTNDRLKQYYVTPYKLWRPKGKKGKSWYHYKTAEDLVEKYINATPPWEKE